MDHVDSGFQDSFSGHWKTESFFGNIMNLDVYNVECGVYTFFNKLIFFHSFFFFGYTQGMWKFFGQRSNPSHGSDLSHSSDNAGSLTH